MFSNNNELLESCLCGSKSYKNDIINNINVLICNDCNIIRQSLKMTEIEYFSFYKNDYYNSFQKNRGTATYDERYQHDRNISKLRLKEYQKYLKPNIKILDIGSSNNAFVDLMNEKNYDAYGLELSNEAKKFKKVFNNDLLKLSFLSEEFDFITLHDVIEHFIEPQKYIIEIYRILSQKGKLIIDLPNFFVDEGKHHWKKIEHLWFLTEDQAKLFFNDCNFKILEIKYPIPSKIVFYCEKN